MEALASQSLHSKSVIATGLTSELMKKAARTFLSSETSERLQERRRQNLNSSSYKLSVLAANFGNLSRPSRINKKAITIDAPSVLAQFLTKNFAHVRCIMESEELLKNKVLYDLMEEQGLIGCHGTLNTHLSCYALGNHTTSVKVLHEEDEKPMPWSVF